MCRSGFAGRCYERVTIDARLQPGPHTTNEPRRRKLDNWSPRKSPTRGMLITAAILFGPVSASAAMPQVGNLGFESGLAAWTSTGNVFTTQNAFSFSAAEGAQFAVVDANGCSGSTLTQTFTGAAGEVIRGQAAFTAGDYLPFNDYGVLRICCGDTDLFYADVASVGDFGQTPWTEWSFTIPADGTYTLHAECRNLLDCAFNSYLLLDGPVNTNTAPDCDAGADLSVECDAEGGAVVTLGAAAYDPDGDALTFEWSVPMGSLAMLDDTMDPITSGFFPLGQTLLTLTVTDGNGGMCVDDVLIEVLDSTPPSVVMTTDLITLWPPNHDMVLVFCELVVSDECTAPEDLTVVCEITSSEPDDAAGDGSFTGDVDVGFGGQDAYLAPLPLGLVYNAAKGSYSAPVLLRAERDGSEAGRTYSIVCDVYDPSGNVNTASCVVVVPHDRKKVK